MTRAPRNIAASVRARLLRLATERREDFQLVITRYANERLLHRLAVSPHAERFVLKGAALFTLWTGRAHRATRDIDLLGYGEPTEERIRAVFHEIITLDVPDDGIAFALDSLGVGPIREDQAYGGVRVTVTAALTNARVPLQIDVGFGDAITPAAEIVEFPTLLDFPAPRLHAYPRETVVAEKVEAMVKLGMANSRMKDFFDIAHLARNFDFDGALLLDALRATFARRGTPFPRGEIVALSPAFENDDKKVAQWKAFLRKSGAAGEDSLASTLATIRTFLESPIAAAATDAVPWRARWSRDTGWKL